MVPPLDFAQSFAFLVNALSRSEDVVLAVDAFSLVFSLLGSSSGNVFAYDVNLQQQKKLMFKGHPHLGGKIFDKGSI